MVPEKQIEEFVNKLRQAAGDNLESVILYGSAASGEYIDDQSDVNLLCVLRDTSLPKLQRLSTTLDWWTRKEQPAPLITTRQEIESSADVFSIEYFDMQKRHRVLFGDDPLANITIPMRLHRAQVEYELREKMILLRQRLLLAGSRKDRLWTLLLDSLPSFSALFRHALMAFDGQCSPSGREAFTAIGSRLGIDSSAFLDVLEVREGRVNARQFNVESLAARYLAAVEQVTATVDKMLDSEQ
ncbi:MAG TPA: nucleotidyltransferase domain-containing protein [Terriglobales bacterium]|nr:nucleotidyltransferase domain-containing protein [Terriglobales bacterium]